MRILRTALIERIDAIESERKKAFDVKASAQAKAHEKARRDWHEKVQPALLDELRRAVATVRKGIPLDRAECRLREFGGRGAVPMFDGPPSAPDSKRQPDAELAALRQLLANSTDEYISTTEIKNLGFQPRLFLRQ